MTESMRELFEAALLARTHAHAPYSGCQVGAAIRLTTGDVYSGCNVENASYGATICAERGAIMTAVAQNGKIAVSEVLVLTDVTPAWPPCGMCRQVVAEFATPDCQVHLANVSGQIASSSFAFLMPSAFDVTYLEAGKESQ